VASRMIATALPRPICLIEGTPVKTNTAKTEAMITAAEVMVLADAARPSATAWRESPVASQRSRMRDSRKTS
jgi:hypothetical protein